MKCSLITERVNKLCCLHTVEYCIGINKNKLCICNMSASPKYNMKGKRLNTKNTYSTYMKFQIDKISPQLWESEWFLLLGLTDWTGEWMILLVALVVFAHVYTYSQIYQFVYLKFMDFSKCNFYLSVFLIDKFTEAKKKKKGWWYIPYRVYSYDFFGSGMEGT